MSIMHSLYPVADIRQIEQAAQAMLPAGTLMRRAGAAAAQAATMLLADAPHQAPILVLAGPGNNGGDALEASAQLAHAGWTVTVALFADPAKQSADAQESLQRARASTVDLIDPADVASASPVAWSLVIDGLFGIGLTRPVTGSMRTMIEHINALDCPVLALDVPSGLDADTGTIVGDGIAMCASHTITFIADKPGLHTCDGRDHAGNVEVATLDIDKACFPASHACLNDPALFADAFHPRAHNSHKGSFGDVALLGGAHGMCGAPVLAARAAAHCGAGRVFIGFVDEPLAYDSMQPELMCRAADKLDFTDMTLVAGPGMGNSHNARDLLFRVLAANTTLVLDADALNLIASDTALQEQTRQRHAPTLMTPHPLEAARLLAIGSGDIQADRIAAARALAATYDAIVILKGSGTVIARPDSQVAINPSGNPSLATAGSGDVLAGVCGALLAQGIAPWQAALASVWLHGHAADKLVEHGIGPVGLIASELAPAIRTALNQLIEKPRPH